MGYIDYQQIPPRPEHSEPWDVALSIERRMCVSMIGGLCSTPMSVIYLLTTDSAPEQIYSYDPARFPWTPAGEQQ